MKRTLISTFMASIGIDNLSINGTAVPEPGSLALLSTGGLVLLRRRR